MNPLLLVKLSLNSEKNPQKPGPRNLRANSEVSWEKIDGLSESLRAVMRFYNGTPKILKDILVDVNYNDIVAKSNRIRDLLKPDGINTNDVVVGARFSEAEEGQENHIITYYVDSKVIENTLRELEIVKVFILEKLAGKATCQNFNKPNSNINYNGYELSESKLRNLIIDCSRVDSFSVPRILAIPDRETFLVTLFKTELPLDNLFEKLSINMAKYPYSLCGENTISTTKGLLAILTERIPYLISMISSDLSKITLDEVSSSRYTERIEIPPPNDEPTIGVIDTLFDNIVYFKDWVTSTDDLDDIERPTSSNVSREHGTEVTSIIVDGPRLNPWLDDGCGRFKVRHFGVCVDRISPARLVRKIKGILAANPDIHVWNLSLGTEDEVSKNFVSYDAMALDELQLRLNVIFVVSGTNDNRIKRSGSLKVASPADSLNSLVVNSVKGNGRPASYSRRGNILSFFRKPDVSYYGGDYDERIMAYSPSNGIVQVYGTSFAAPWISRKLCYLIEVMHLSREVAKALIIDSAAGWNYKSLLPNDRELLGYGIVPKGINDVLSAPSEEIKFVLYGTSTSYKTANYAIPVPKDEDNKYPFVARATLCYFPPCSRLQGVDYTSRELSLKFGRVNSNGQIIDVNENLQDEGGSYVNERQSRQEFRKWENTKFISKILKNHNRPLKSYPERFWGLTITSKERLSTKIKQGLNFGLVITLREVNGINRIQDFIKACSLRGFIVNQLNIQNQLDIYNTSQEEIIFE